MTWDALFGSGGDGGDEGDEKALRLGASPAVLGFK